MQRSDDRTMAPPGAAPLGPAALAVDAAASPTSTAGDPGDAVVFPLSFAQERLWFLDQLDPGQSVYNVPAAFRLAGRLDVGALERALDEIVRRHEALRTTFIAIDGAPMQLVAPPPTAWSSLRMIDLRALPEGERAAEGRRLTVAEARRPFDLRHGPLLRTTLVQMDDEEMLLLITMHHMVSEGGWSLGVFLRELDILYAAFGAGRPSPLPELPIQYGDYAVWRRTWPRGEVLERQTVYWKEHLAGVPALLELPTDRPRQQMQTYRGATQPLWVTRDVADALRALSRGEGATLFMTLMAAWQTLLLRLTGQPDVVVGTPVAGRARPETEGLIGFFLNVLAVRTDLGGDPPFRELLRRVREAALGAYSNQDLPFKTLVELLHPQRSLSYSPLFQVMFSFQNVPQHALTLAGLGVTPLEVDNGGAMFDLTLYLWEGDEGLRGVLEYNTDLFDAETAARMAGQYETLLRGIALDPARPISMLPLLTDDERLQLVAEWNDTARYFPKHLCVHELIEAQVARKPNAVAASYDGQDLTYLELDRRANRLARYLRARGVGPEVLVGICVERSLDMLVGLLGILKAGGAYVPLDPAFPPERLAFMLADSGAPVLLTQAGVAIRLADFAGVVVRLDADAAAIAAESAEPASPVAAAEQLAYVLYTSGSTGRPKGVQVTHRNLVNFLTAMLDELQPRAGDTLLAVTTLSFDIAGLELWLPLLTGARVAIVSRDVAADGVRLAAAIDRADATLMQATPATWQLLLQSGWKGRKGLKVLCGGEAMPRELVAPLRARCAALWNLYGPTETTIWSAAARVTRAPEPGEPVPIGRPIANTQIYLLDVCLTPVPIGVAGELYIGGAGVARGYLNRPELNAERFLPDPFSDHAGACLYRTGDLARYRPGGAIEFLGRVDQQVKLRGFRIELGEIEASLVRHPRVQEAAAVVREDAPGDRRLVAYIVAAEPAPESGELRGFLQRHLPDYMVPSTFVALPALPLTPNRKVDRRALPAPESAAVVRSRAIVGPRDNTELQLVELWEQVLGTRGLGVHDNFFDAGGHSLLAVRLFAQLHKVTGQHLPLATLFQAPTVAELAEVLRQDGWTASWAPLVTLQRGEEGRRPLFLVHAVGGNVLNYRDLAFHLGAAQPVHGLQAVGLDGTREPHSRMEPLAAEYVAAIRAVQPEGPYHLGGSSFGGVAAFEMARQLRAAGHAVGLVALLDSFPVLHDTSKAATGLHAIVRRYVRYAGHHARTLASMSRREQLSYLRARVTAFGGRLGRRLDGRSGEGQAAEPPLAAALRNVKRADYTAYVTYRPTPVDARLALFRTADWQETGDTDPTAGWEEFALGGVDVHEVPGDHRSMLREPHAAVLAERLLPYLH